MGATDLIQFFLQPPLKMALSPAIAGVMWENASSKANEVLDIALPYWLLWTQSAISIFARSKRACVTWSCALCFFPYNKK